MARMARFKISEGDSWYHLTGRVGGVRGEYPLADPVAARRLIDMIRHFGRIYFCEVGGFCVMGNHYHLVTLFEGPHDVSRRELEIRAKKMYPGQMSQLRVQAWSDEQWERFRERLFDVSEFMRNVQAAFARWYNRAHDRRGRFWADRFKSVYLENEQAVLDCLLYVELNPVRAGLVQRPEKWKASSIGLREIGEDGWLMPLPRLLGRPSRKKALLEFRERLYHRGAIPSKAGQAAISPKVLQEEATRGFATRGVYRKRLAYFVDGLAIGTEGFLREQIARLRSQQRYLRRKHPIPQLDGVHLSLREQRTTAISF